MGAYITPSTQQDNLAELARRVRDAIAATQAASVTVLRSALDAGAALLEAQDQVPANGWGRWLRDNCYLSQRSAELYAQLARHRDEIDVLSGASLAQLVRRMSAPGRACLVADIADGRVVLQGLTIKAIAALAGVNLSYVHVALNLTPEQRTEVRRGARPLISPRLRAAPASSPS